MELYGWAGGPIKVINETGRERLPHDVHVHDNFIHHNQHTGKDGYGVEVSSGGWALIERNVFDFNRHAVTHGNIDSSGGFRHKGGYTAIQNLVLKGGGFHCSPIQNYVQQFDVHGDRSCVWWGAFDCGESGQEYHVTFNAFQFTMANSFLLRGTAGVGAFVNNNVFAHANIGDAVGATPSVHNPIVGPNRTGFDSFGEYGVCDIEGAGYDDLLLTTGVSWWYMSRAKQHWTFLNSNPETIEQIALGDFEGHGRCDAFKVEGDEWFISSGASSPWHSLGHFSVPFAELRFGHFTGGQRMEIFRRTNDGQWWIISPGVFGWTPIQSSPLPLSELHFGSLRSKGTTDVVARISGQWKASWGGQSTRQPLNPGMSDGLNNTVMADMDGKGTDDILRNSNGKWEISVGGRSTWRTLVEAPTNNFYCCWIGNFDGSRGSQLLGLTGPEIYGRLTIFNNPFDPLATLGPDEYRRSMIWSRMSPDFTPYGLHSY